MRSLKKKSNGFTLVEIIVVMVILAILAAILVPSLLGYIDKAQEKQYVLHAKSIYTAAQSALSEAYGKGMELEGDNIDKIAENIATISDAEMLGCEEFRVYTRKTYGLGENGAKPSLAEKHAMYTVAYVEYTENGTTEYMTINPDGSTDWDTTSSGYSGSTTCFTWTK